MAELLHQFSDWYLSVLAQGGYWLIGALMALESTVVPIPSEVIIPPAAYLAHTQGQLSLAGVADYVDQQPRDGVGVERVDVGYGFAGDFAAVF